jgi:hypothetical protein
MEPGHAGTLSSKLSRTVNVAAQKQFKEQDQ